MRALNRRSPATLALAAGAWLALTSALACGDDSSAARATSAEIEAPGVCELPRGGYPGACNECLADRCCAAIEMCKGSPACAAQLECMIPCQAASDPSECSRACVAAGRDPDYVAYDDCSFEECRTQCWL
jgi:hypothetical protein